jgi:hypothetical protein
MELDSIYEIEKLILNKCSWRINLTTPIEIKNIILTNILMLQMQEFEEIVQNWINFSIVNYEIYQKYDHFILTAACILLTCNCLQENSTFILEILHYINADIVQIEECMASILMKFNEDSRQSNDQMYVDMSIASLNETDISMHSQEKIYAPSNFSRTSSYSEWDMMDNFQDNDLKHFEDNEEQVKSLEFKSTNGNRRKRLKNLKLKKLNLKNGKIKKISKTKKIKLFYERRMKYNRSLRK